MNKSQIVLRMAQINEKANREGRELTQGERQTLEGLIEAIPHAEALEKSLGGPQFAAVDQLNGYWGTGDQMDPGAKFVASEGYKSIRNSESRPQTWSSGLIEVGSVSLSAKGTLLEGVGSPGSGTGGGWVPTPQVVPGMVDVLFQPLTLESLLLSGQATGNTVRYVVEGTATSAAAGVAEAGQKPESTLAFSTRDEPSKKVATVIQISDELIEDAPAIQTFINGQLSAFVNIEAERQLFRGTSGGNEVQGILTSRGVPVYAGGTAVGNRAVQLFKAMNGLRGSAFVEPEWIVLHPSDWQIIRLLTDSAGPVLRGWAFPRLVRQRRSGLSVRAAHRRVGFAVGQAGLRHVRDRRCGHRTGRL